MVLFKLFGFPYVPARGDLSFAVDAVAIFLSVTMLIILVFFVIDVVRQARWFVKALSRPPTIWNPKLHRDAGVPNVYQLDRSDVLDIDLIARRTEVIDRFVYLPSLIIFLMLVSRNRYFDNWDWPPGLVIVFMVNAAYMVYSYQLLRGACEKARQYELQRLRARLVTAIAKPKPIRERKEAIELAIKQVEDERRGAFASFLQQPIVGAILLPFSGFGAWAILQYLASMY